VRFQKLYIYVLIILSCQNLFSQEKYIDASTQRLLDSLNNRITALDKQIRDFAGNRDAGFFYARRELDMTRFLREYEELVFDEKLIQAQQLIDSRIKASEKRSDKFAVDYYMGYKTKLTKLRANKRLHYQQLFTKEKTFKQEYEQYIAPNDEFAFLKTLRMIDLAIKYAEEMGRNETLLYLHKYKNYTKALLLDLHSEYDLMKLTASESAFLKVFNATLESDSLEVIKQGRKLVESCFEFSAAALTKLDSNYFVMQKLVVANALADWNERQGISTELSTLTGQSVVARRDSINREGIYQWNDLIIVIGSVNFNSKTESIRRGEAIIDADRTLYNYIRINKLSKVNKNMEMGKTIILPIKDKDRVAYFQYDNSKRAWQYIVAYTSVISPKFTREMGRFLPPLQFQDKFNDLSDSTIISK
jgi:hypothetical protein